MIELKQKRMLEPPKRFIKPSVFMIVFGIIFMILIYLGLQNANITWDRLSSGFLNMIHFIVNAFPPNASRFGPIMMRIFETFQIALVGTTLGVILSLPVAFLISKNTNKNIFVRTTVKTIVSALRTVPDLIWALIFVISIGLGPLAGILTIAVDTIGFCARFFSERIEEMDSGVQEALESTGASKIGAMLCSILPIGIPSFVGTSLYSIEKAVRSAVILGLVGAGGIGVELNTAMSLRQFDEALMIILMILVVVLLVEQVSGRIRSKII